MCVFVMFAYGTHYIITMTPLLHTDHQSNIDELHAALVLMQDGCSLPHSAVSTALVSGFDGNRRLKGGGEG